jgi:ATP-binding cassette subfamily B protein
MMEPKTTREMLAEGARLARAVRPEIIREKRLLLGSLLSLLFAMVFQVLEPWPLKFIFDSFVHGNKHGARWETLNGLSPQAFLGLAALSLVVIAAMAALTEYASASSMSLAVSRILGELRARAFRHLSNLSISFHERSQTGDLITRITYDIDRLREVSVNALLPLLTNTLTLSAMLAVMFWMNWRLGLIVLLAVPLFVFAIARLTRRIKAMARLQRSRESDVAGTTAEVLGSIRIVQALSLQNTFLNIFSIANRKSLRAGVKAQKLAAGLERTVEVLVAATTAVILWTGAHYVLDGRLTAGDLIVFVTYLRSFFRPLRQLAKYIGQIAKALASSDRILDLLETRAEIQDGLNAIPAPRFTGHIRFENVSFAYHPGKTVLRNVSFEILPGQRVVIVGPSGSGKSTLASLLLRFHDPSEGRILVDGKDIRDYSTDSLRSQISVVMQESVLFATTVRDNIAFGTKGASIEEVQNAAKLANAHDFILAMRHQYDTRLGERGATLSGGQRQRIAIARAAIRQAPILVLDEPTTGLDRKNEVEVSAALEHLSSGCSTLLITHSLETAGNADLILFLCDGCIVERGTHQRLLASGGAYAALLRRQVLEFPLPENAWTVEA